MNEFKNRIKGEAKREANKPRIAFGLLKEPDVPELENDDDNDEMEPKRKRKTRAIPTRKAKERMNISHRTRICFLFIYSQ